MGTEAGKLLLVLVPPVPQWTREETAMRRTWARVVALQWAAVQWAAVQWVVVLVLDHRVAVAVPDRWVAIPVTAAIPVTVPDQWVAIRVTVPDQWVAARVLDQWVAILATAAIPVTLPDQWAVAQADPDQWAVAPPDHRVALPVTAARAMALSRFAQSLSLPRLG